MTLGCIQGTEKPPCKALCTYLGMTSVIQSPFNSISGLRGSVVSRVL